jgi:hypothetical protein
MIGYRGCFRYVSESEALRGGAARAARSAREVRAIIAHNVVGSMPTLLMLRFVAAAEEAGVVALATRATVSWLVVVVLWTTAVRVTAARENERRARDGRSLVPHHHANARHHRSATT